ncbi:unnamed protein product [Polarella glacialis]|uniref:Fe2OG dioxygenase domain-containing protein n=1 Tax=Polarella glacialis TaxID=89957 RepID=A0A813LIL3_POLGL|nr:unnamed protein product [Polarella glacialis]
MFSRALHGRQALCSGLPRAAKALQRRARRADLDAASFLPRAGSFSSPSSSSSSSVPLEVPLPEIPELEHSRMLADLPGFAQALGKACRVGDGGAGCFLVTGLPPRLQDLHEELLETARAFFARPAEEKALVDYRQSPQFRGYMWQGAENTAGRVDEREQIEFGREETLLQIEKEASGRLFDRLRGPNLWPQTPPTLRPLVTAWLHEMEELSLGLTRALAVSLGLEAEALDHYFQAPHLQAKLVHYPPPSLASYTAEGEDGLGLGVGAHSDSGFLTLLLQDEVGGLEFLDSSGGWVPANPVKGSVVCNLGEVVQLMTRGVYPATVHRVKRPSLKASQGLGRLSAPFFWNPSLNQEIEPLNLPGATPPKLVGRRGESQNRMLRSYGMNAFKSLARSHPTVFARHHPDLTCMSDGQVVRRDGER